MLFRKNAIEPIVKEIELVNHYKFMYNVFLLTTQNTLYLFLEEDNDFIKTITFDFRIYKFGYPNDEALHGHPLYKYGLSFYGIYEVQNSLWIEEIKNVNKVHPGHRDSMYSAFKHFIITYKDNTLEVLSEQFQEITLSKADLDNILSKEINYLKKESH